MANITTMSKDTVSQMLEKKRQDIQQLLPSHVDTDRFIKSALLAVARDPKLLQCTKESLFTSIVNAGELGLDFTPAKGHAYLIPYGKEATFMPGYRGFIQLARNSGEIKAMDAHVVYENDEFELMYGSDNRIVHKPALNNKGNSIGAYAIAFFNDGSHQFVFMDMDDLQKIRNTSKMKGGIPWKEWEDEMNRKSAIRRLAKYLPISPEVAKAIDADNQHFNLDPDKEVKVGVTGLLDTITDSSENEDGSVEEGRDSKPKQQKSTPEPNGDGKIAFE